MIRKTLCLLLTLTIPASADQQVITGSAPGSCPAPSWPECRQEPAMSK
jgi:hypothetical protein